MSVTAPPSARPFVALGSLVLVLATIGAIVLCVQQALAARPPHGYQADIVNIARQLGLAPARPTFSEEGPGRPVGPGGANGQLSLAAQTIGISLTQLRQELAGASLQQVAQNHGVDPTTLANALKTASDAQVDAAVSDGRLTADQATQRKAQADQRIDQMMTQVRGSGGRALSSTGQ
jgi:hypothetical protein